MARPLDIDIKVPLQSDGWVHLQVHIDDLTTTSVPDQEFIISLMDRIGAFLEWLVKAGLADAGLAAPHLSAPLTGEKKP